MLPCVPTSSCLSEWPRVLHTPVTKMGGSPFPHRGVVLDMGRYPMSSVAIGPTADVDADAGITGICTSTSTDILALSGKNPHS